MGLWTNRLFKFEFWVAPPKKVHWVLWGFLRDYHAHCVFLQCVRWSHRSIKKITGIRFPEHWPPNRSLDVLYLFVPMTFLRDGSSYDPWRIVQATDRWMGLREKVENWRREVKLPLFTGFYTCEVVQNFVESAIWCQCMLPFRIESLWPGDVKEKKVLLHLLGRRCEWTKKVEKSSDPFHNIYCLSHKGLVEEHRIPRHTCGNLWQSGVSFLLE